MRLEDMRGQRFGRYEIVDVLGRGGMAAVYRARDTVLQREVALKLLYPQYSSDTMLLERFRREAVLAAQLDHPNIVPIYDVGESTGVTYIAMKLMPGLSLADVLNMRGRLPFNELLPVLRQIASALDYAHGRGIVHRDIKPANILLLSNMASSSTPSGSQAAQTYTITDSSVAMLTDFGIAKSLDAPGMTSTSVMIGTPDYMAPEQIRSERSIDRRVDVYALAALTYRALTGRRLYDGNTQEVLLGHLSGGYVAASSVNPGLPQAMDAVFAHGLAIQTTDRYASAGEFVRELDQAWTSPPAPQIPGAGVQNQSSAAATQIGSVQPAQSAAQIGATSAASTVRGSARPAGLGPAQAAGPTPAALQARRRHRNSLLLLIVFGLISLLVVGLVLTRIWAFSQQAQPTQLISVASATPEPAAPSETATHTPSFTPSPSPTETAIPASPSLALPSPVPITPVVVVPTPQPPRPRPSATPRPPTATARPSTATAVPATDVPPSATAEPTLCPIEITGGFKELLEQNEPVRTRLGCPVENMEGGIGQSVEQKFQNGSMFYFAPRELIYVLAGFENGNWLSFEQAALADQPTPTPAPPPAAGLYVPVRGFGLVWGYYENVRNQLGYGVEPEQGPLEGARQRFQGGTLLYSQRGLGRGKTLYALYEDGSFERYRDPNQ